MKRDDQDTGFNRGKERFLLGIDCLLSCQRDLLEGRRIGLVSHAAAVDVAGRTSAEKLVRTPGLTLTALFGPEHGFDGGAAAGEITHDGQHREWHIPIFSLYGDTRKPTPAMLEHVDLLIIDFQDLGARPYTYVSTLRLVLEAAAAAGKRVIVADRPVPLPRQTDGPMLDPAFESFVGLIPGPLQYGMTQGETARWLAAKLNLNLDLHIAALQGYHREMVRQPDWPTWIPPSPRIRTWEAACLFTATVFGEALPALDYGSGTEYAFQLIGAPWLEADRLASALAANPVPGLALEPCRYEAKSGLYRGRMLDGLKLAITDYPAWRPVSASVTLLATLQSLYGPDPLWSATGTRESWFDTLYGTDRVRLALKSGATPQAILANWHSGLEGFSQERARFSLYTSP